MAQNLSNAQAINPFGTAEVLASSFAAKFGTKGEIYRFLTTEALLYLPAYAQVTIWHMKDIAATTKKVSLNSLISYSTGHQMQGRHYHLCPSI